MMLLVGERQTVNVYSSCSFLKARHFPAPVAKSSVRVPRSFQCRAANNYGSSSDSSRAVLEVVSYGRAFTETLSARMGSMVEELLSEISKQSAESGQALREFQEEVEERAQRELLVSVSDSGSSTSYEATVSAFSTAPVYSSNGRITAGNGRQPVVATPPDLQETVDELRAEMALTRASVQSYKKKLQQNNPL